MKKTKPFLLFILFVVSAVSGWAQQTEVPATNAWTLKQCVDYALANNLTIQRSMYNVETSEVDYNQSKMNFIPNLNANIHSPLSKLTFSALASQARLLYLTDCAFKVF